MKAVPAQWGVPTDRLPIEHLQLWAGDTGIPGRKVAVRNAARQGAGCEVLAGSGEGGSGVVKPRRVQPFSRRAPGVRDFFDQS